ncbi:hypothetical protein AB1L05_22520 [Cytobacillus horneckiae]|uniref:hypothetical protein n=1 Tax=Cytobacillus horneckiae TaxID=549687 RepID=UPI0034CF561B
MDDTQLGFTENNVEYHIKATDEEVTVVAKINNITLTCTGETFKGTIAEAKLLIKKIIE